jgi:hypothetical protein
MHIHTYSHKHVYISIHTYIHTYIHMHVNTHTHAHTHMHAYHIHTFLWFLHISFFKPFLLIPTYIHANLHTYITFSPVSTFTSLNHCCLLTSAWPPPSAQELRTEAIYRKSAIAHPRKLLCALISSSVNPLSSSMIILSTRPFEPSKVSWSKARW